MQRLGRLQATAGQQAGVYDIIIVGGGLTGLVAGQALAAKHGVSNFLVTEAKERVGGNITSREGGGYVWEEGPNSFQPNDSMLQIAVRGSLAMPSSRHATWHCSKLPCPQVDSGCDKELVFGDPTAPRFVWWEGKLRPVPSGVSTVCVALLQAARQRVFSLCAALAGPAMRRAGRADL